MKKKFYWWLIISILPVYFSVFAAQNPITQCVGPYWLNCSAYIQAPTKQTYTLTFFDRNNILVTATSKGVGQIWNPTQQGIITKDSEDVPLDGVATAVAYFPSPRAYSAVGFNNGTISFYSLMNNMSKYGSFKAHDKPVIALAISPDLENPYLAAAFDDNTVKIWKIKEDRAKMTFSGELIKTLSYADQKEQKGAKLQKTTLKPSIAFTDNNILLISDGDALLIRRYAINQGRMIEALAVHLNILGKFKQQPGVAFIATTPTTEYVAVVIRAAGAVFFLDKNNGTFLHQFFVQEQISCIDISSDGKKIAIGSGIGSRDIDNIQLPERRYQARILDIDTGKLLRAYTHEFPLTSVKFNRDSSLLVSSTQNAVMLWNVSDRLARVLRPGNWVYSLAFHSLYVMGVGLRDGSVVTWNGVRDTAPNTFKVHTDAVTSVIFDKRDPTKIRFYSTSRDGTVQYWDSGARVYKVDTKQDWVNGATLINNGTIIASAGKDCSIRFWSAQSGNTEFRGAFTPAAAVIYQKGDKPKEGETEYDTSVVEVRGSQQDPLAHSYWVMALATSNNTLISGSYDGTIQFWNGTTHIKTVDHGAWVHTLATSQTVPLVASAGGMSYAMGHMGPGAVRPGSVNEDVILGQGEGGGSTVTHSRFGPSIKIWDVNGTLQNVIANAHESGIFCLAFSPDGTKLASGSADGTAKIWDIASGKLLMLCQHYDWVYALAFSPDGQWLATGTLGQDGSAQDFQEAFRTPPSMGQGGHSNPDPYYLHMADILKNAQSKMSPGEAKVCMWDIAGI